MAGGKASGAGKRRARAVKMFTDLALSRRLERAEGHACREYAEARRRLCPESGAEWIECGGAYAVFDGIDSPVTQSFGLGLFEELSSDTLDTIERFFFDRGASADHEVSPFAGAGALSLLCERYYLPLEVSNVLYRRTEKISVARNPSIHVRFIEPQEAELWADVNARGWAQDYPEMLEFIRMSGAISASRSQAVCFLGEIDHEPGAAGALFVHEGVALLAGAATVPHLRRRGLQAALLEERMSYAANHGCDLVMMVAEAGSNSQRNAERQGFRVAYTRIKWRLRRP